jgi:hypothetical protein
MANPNPAITALFWCQGVHLVLPKSYHGSLIGSRAQHNGRCRDAKARKHACDAGPRSASHSGFSDFSQVSIPLPNFLPLFLLGPRQLALHNGNAPIKMREKMQRA